MVAFQTFTDCETPPDRHARSDERFQTLLESLLPEVRRRHASYSDERVFETAVFLAAYRLSEERPRLDLDFQER
jgi:hypothetical protein